MKCILFAEPALVSLVGLAVVALLLFFVGVTVIVIFFIRASGKKPLPTTPPLNAPTKVVPPPPAPRHCPQCGTALNPNVPEGLCPACLLKHGIATEGGVPPGTPPFTPPPFAELQKLFPQLEILEQIGQGGMGAVYKARQPALERIVALKILAPKGGGDLDFAGRFTREARALARLSHPNIVGVYDFGEIQTGANVSATGAASQPSTSLHYFIMEFVDGLNLRQVEQAGKLSPRQALEIIPQICAALQFAHDEGIVHRDIKPENVLLDKKGRVKIADFGLAKILGQEKDFRLTGARDVMGTPHYMAPEQVEKPQEVDHRADIYSLGVVFYELLTGELPIGKFQPPSAKVQVDVRLDDVVLRSLAKEPERRYQHASEVKTEVETIAQSPGGTRQEAQPLRAGAQPVVTQKPDRFWRWIAVGALAVIAIPMLVAIFGMLAAIAIPNFVKARKKQAQAIHEREAAAAAVGLQQGAIALWHADGDANDAINGHNGVMDRVGFTDGIFGQAFAFDPDTYPYGTYTGIKVPDDPAFELTNSLSISGWIRPRGNGYIILCRGDHRPGLDPYTLSLPGDNHLRFGICDENGESAYVEVAFAMNQWIHVAGTYDNGLMRLYTNGVLANELTTSVHPFAKLLASESPGLGIGNLNDGGNNFPFIGDIDELALYDRALLYDEVRNAYQAGRKAAMAARPPKQVSGDIVAWWNGDKNALDHVGRSHGALMNGAEYVPGIKGEAFKFDGKGAYVKVPPTPALNSLRELTIEFWMKADVDNEMQNYQGLVISDFYGVEISNGSGGTMGVNFLLGLTRDESLKNPSVEGFSRRTGLARPEGDGQTTVSDFAHISDVNGGGAPVTAGEWHHIAGTYDGKKMQLYVDGQPWGQPREFSGPVKSMLPRSSLSIGSEDGRTTCSECIGKRYFKGLIDDVKIYNRAVSANEIASDYERNKPFGQHLEAQEFSPAVYRQLAPRQWLDLKTGKLTRMPQSISPDDGPSGFDYAQAISWAKEQSLDLMADPDTNNPSALVFSGEKLVHLEREDWKGMAVKELIGELRHGKALSSSLDLSQSGFQPVLRFGSYNLPAYFGFRGHDGSVGMLEISGFTTSPRQVHIGYKLVQLAASKSNATNSEEIVSLAKRWLTLTDGEEYSESWKQASAMFQGGVTEQAWVNSMNTFRKPLGALISRKMNDSERSAQAPGAPDGQYLVMQFESSFFAKKSAIETVTFMLEKDGQWRAAGYFIK